MKPLVRKSERLLRMLAFTVAVAGFVSAARASVVYQINSGGVESFDVSIDSTAINGTMAGGILINRMSSTDPSLPASYVTVSTDIKGTLYLGQNYEYNTPITPFAGQGGINPNWGTGVYGDGSAAKAIQNAAYLFYAYGQLSGAGLGGTTEQKAALQLAVWAALYNTTAAGTVTGSRFSVTGGDAAAIADANAWLAGLSGDYGLTGYLLYPSQGNLDGQAPQELLIAPSVLGASVPVPEAPTVIASLLLLFPLAASAFKILRKQPAMKS